MADELVFRPSKALLIIWLFLVVLLGFVVGGVAAGIAYDEKLNPMLYFAVGFLPLVLLIGGWATLYFNTIIYRIDDNHAIRSHGVLWKVRRSVPLEKITNIDVRRGPVERILGIGQVWVFTPSTGAMTPEEKIVGVRNADAIKQEIVERSEAAKAGTAAAEAEETQAVRASEEVVGLLRDILLALRSIEARLGGPGKGGDAT